jgi:hypothetical protein
VLGDASRQAFLRDYAEKLRQMAPKPPFEFIYAAELTIGPYDAKLGSFPLKGEPNRTSYPSSHRFVGDIQTAFRNQIFDVAIAERETHIQPNGVPDDRRRKLVAGERDRHPPPYPANHDALPL